MSARNVHEKTDSKHKPSIAVALLCLLLGLAIVIQVKNINSNPYVNLRQEDLIRLVDEANNQIDNLSKHEQKLKDELSLLKKEYITHSKAKEIAQKENENMRILKGTVPVEGPGIIIEIKNSNNQIRLAHILSIISELRNAGAKAIDLNNNRINGLSWLDIRKNNLILDNKQISYPYIFSAIGDPKVLDGALNIIGGPISVLKLKGFKVNIVQKKSVVIMSTKPAINNND